jgi:hypothetical protein
MDFNFPAPTPEQWTQTGLSLAAALGLYGLGHLACKIRRRGLARIKGEPAAAGTNPAADAVKPCDPLATAVLDLLTPEHDHEWTLGPVEDCAQEVKHAAAGVTLNATSTRVSDVCVDSVSLFARQASVAKEDEDEIKKAAWEVCKRVTRTQMLKKVLAATEKPDRKTEPSVNVTVTGATVSEPFKGMRSEREVTEKLKELTEKGFIGKHPIETTVWPVGQIRQTCEKIAKELGVETPKVATWAVFVSDPRKMPGNRELFRHLCADNEVQAAEEFVRFSGYLPVGEYGMVRYAPGVSPAPDAPIDHVSFFRWRSVAGRAHMVGGPRACYQVVAEKGGCLWCPETVEFAGLLRYVCAVKLDEFPRDTVGRVDVVVSGTAHHVGDLVLAALASSEKA